MCNFNVPFLLYYANVPTLVVGFLLSVFILFSDKKSSSNRYLFLFIVFIWLGTLNSMFQWIVHDVNLSLYLSQVAVLEVISLLFFLYFTHAFAGEHLSSKKKFLLFIPFLPIILLLFTNYNSYMLDGSTCTVQFGKLYIYVIVVGILYAGLSVRKLYSFAHKNKNNLVVSKQVSTINYAIVFVSIWILSLAGFSGMLTATNHDWGDQVLLFIPLGLLIFIGIIAYAITEYQFLKTKLLAAQTLTYSIWILIGSQYFFAGSVVEYALTSFTLLLSILFGIMLIKSIREEVERKEQLQNMADKLAQANDQLRKLDNAKTEFISIASHQLRTPITAIKGFSSLLLEGSYGDVSESVHGALEKIYVSSERLVDLIEDLLNVSRIESGRMQFDFKKDSVERLIKELYDNFILIAKNKKFYLDMKLPENPLPEIMMDYSKIRELVSNFIDNALKYTEKGGATIKAELRGNGVVIDENGFVIPDKVSEFGKMIRITVSDTGIGIPREEIPYLFKKFSRGKDVSRLHVGGTGLGLYVGKAIAENHHGQVWVESDGAGMGSRFIIEIPVEHAT